MKRREFILDSCVACLTLAAASTALSGCLVTKINSGELEKDGLRLKKENFRTGKNTAFASFIIVKNEALKFPICVFRFSETQFSAVWMRCSHQGAELQAVGDTLHCPAHGSEFDNLGKVRVGPAVENLRSFPVTVTKDAIFIDLRKQA